MPDEKMYLIDYSVVEKSGRKFRIATFFCPNARRKVVAKFLNENVKVPESKVITPEDFAELQEVEVRVDLQGNVLEIT